MLEIENTINAVGLDSGKISKIIDFQKQEETPHKPELRIVLKYHHGVAVINRIERVSCPGLRIYRNKNKLPKVLNGLGIAIISTSKGVMSDKAARAANQGGEVIAYVD